MPSQWMYEASAEGEKDIQGSNEMKQNLLQHNAKKNQKNHAKQALAYPIFHKEAM